MAALQSFIDNRISMWCCAFLLGNKLFTLRQLDILREYEATCDTTGELGT